MKERLLNYTMNHANSIALKQMGESIMDDI